MNTKSAAHNAEIEALNGEFGPLICRCGHDANEHIGESLSCSKCECNGLGCTRFAMKGEITTSDKQCARRGLSAVARHRNFPPMPPLRKRVAGIVLCRNHRHGLTRDKKPLRYVEL